MAETDRHIEVGSVLVWDTEVYEDATGQLYWRHPIDVPVRPVKGAKVTCLNASCGRYFLRAGSTRREHPIGRRY